MPDPADKSKNPSPTNALAALLAAAGWTGRGAGDVAFTGSDPVLASNFRLGCAGAVAVAAQGMAADALWALKTGRPQDIAVDLRAGAMAMRSNRHLDLKDGAVGPQWTNLSGLYPCGDKAGGGWVQLHCNYPWLRDPIIAILNCDADKDAVARALRDRTAAEFETAAEAENLPVYRVRTPAEWQAHPQAPLIARQPPLTITRIGDAPPEPLPDGPRPLSGVRAAELVRVLAGPVCGRTLAEHGADVLRISYAHRPDDIPLAMDTGHGKRSADLDLRDPVKMAVLQDLIKQADVVTQGHRPGTIAGRGLSPEDVAALRPGIIYVSISAWGNQGPWAHRRGFDSLLQCATGMAAEQGSAENPRHLPAQALDYVSGYVAAFGAMEALRRRATEGGSWLVETSLAQAGHWIDQLGRIDQPDARALPDPTNADVADLLEIHETAWGRLEHLKPALSLSETPPHWVLTAAPLGTHPPEWIS
ncbi:MAG: CoA transferase [Rhodospirillaceae bacterium]